MNSSHVVDLKPKLSIVMPTYNAAKTVRAAIDSVIGQNYPNLEFIIIDGGSKDATLDIIREYLNNISFLLTEPDKGIYDAMNKGIDRVTGDWLYFLGADDQLKEQILNKISPYLDQKLSAVYGDIIYDTGHIMHSWLGYGTLMQNTLHHQATFYNKNLFSNFRYDTSYKVISDYELNLQMYLNKKATLFIPHIIATCGSSGVSSVISSKEVNDLRGKYIKNRLVNFLINTVLNTYYLYYKSKKVINTYKRKGLNR